MDTGSGKTHIAIARILAELEHSDSPKVGFRFLQCSNCFQRSAFTTISALANLPDLACMVHNAEATAQRPTTQCGAAASVGLSGTLPDWR